MISPKVTVGLGMACCEFNGVVDAGKAPIRLALSAPEGAVERLAMCVTAEAMT